MKQQMHLTATVDVWTDEGTLYDAVDVRFVQGFLRTEIAKAFPGPQIVGGITIGISSTTVSVEAA